MANIINLINEEQKYISIIEDNIYFIIENIEQYDDIYLIFEELEFNSEEDLYNFIIEIASDKELMYLLEEGLITDFRNKFTKKI